MDRQLSCKKCPKSFKLKYHLQRHEILCTGFQSYITCEECKNIFKTKTTLKVHKLKCKSDKIYKCDECDDIFESYSKLVVHRENKHRTVQCEICEVEIYFKNIQRHMKTHKLTNVYSNKHYLPASTPAWHLSLTPHPTLLHRSRCRICWTVYECVQRSEPHNHCPVSFISPSIWNYTHI